MNPLLPDSVFHRDVRREYPVAVRGDGIYIYDEAGRRYMDGVSCVFVTNVGHGVNEIADAVHRQASTLAFANTRFFTSRAERDLSARLVSLSPKGMARTWICTSGSTANETAVKIARQYHLLRGNKQKAKIVARWQSYHGSTLGALSLTGDIPRRLAFEPYLVAAPHIDPPYCYRCPLGRTYPSCNVACADLLEKAILQVGAEQVSAFIVEPVAGGPLGALAAPPEYLPRIREICDRHDILMIADEVVSGMGRTGRFHAVEHWDVLPDMITLAKGLAGGFSPIGAVIVSDKVYATFAGAGANLVHFETFTGPPLAATAALSVLDYIEKNKLIERARDIGEYLGSRLSELRSLPMVGDVRGMGLLRGIELVSDKATRAPFPRKADVGEQVVTKAFEKGLMLAGGRGCADGISGDTVVIAPPYVITERQVDDLVTMLRDALGEVAASMLPAAA